MLQIIDLNVSRDSASVRVDRNENYSLVLEVSGQLGFSRLKAAAVDCSDHGGDATRRECR